MGYSEDEFIMLVIFSAIGFFGWKRYFLKLRDHVHTVELSKNILTFLPFASAVFLFLILRFFASFDVKTSFDYLVFYIIMGAAWVGGLHNTLPWFGARFQEDVLERNNRAALWAFGGVLLALTACFAGGNIGDGPGWWIVIFSGLLSTGSLFLLMLISALLTSVNDWITIDRDEASGIRYSGWIFATGLILGRASAGNWVSAEQTWVDFMRISMPLVYLLVVFLASNFFFKPTPARPRQNKIFFGIIPAGIYLMIAGTYIFRLGRW